MSTDPLVTVVTASHNYSHFLPQCIQSVKDQTYKNYEYIVVASSCSDDSAAVARSYGVDKVLELDQGNCTNRNVAMFQARGKYLCNLDADDWIKPTFLARAVQQAEDKAIVSTGIQHFGNSKARGIPQGPFTYKDFVETNRIFCCNLFPKKDFVEIGGYDEALNELGLEDYELWISLVKNGCRVKVVPEYLFYYRVHNNSGTVRSVCHEEERQAYIRRKHPV